jgi:hypothetical protein
VNNNRITVREFINWLQTEAEKQECLDFEVQYMDFSWAQQEDLQLNIDKEHQTPHMVMVIG